ncbi:AMP-binding protein [Cupriavidus sp. TMH.W2]|uniref:AMP-binding protein n=1 Tax=Cupriavidus sp. TMH.W2 TaxID=3434465 RepID=UPI003D76B146
MTPNKVAAHFVPSGRTVTYRQLDEEANRVAHLLVSRGIGKGDAVLFAVDNCPEFLYLAWGCQRAGVVFTPASTKLSADDLHYVAQDSGAAAVIVSGMSTAGSAVSDKQWKSALLFAIGVDIPGFERLEDVLLSMPRTLISSPARGREMMYSSGTTGRPKGVRKPIPAIPFDAADPRDVSQEGKPGVGPAMVHLSTSPLYHAAPHRNVSLTLAAGGSTVILEHFDPRMALSAIDSFYVTHSIWVPTMFHRLLRLDANERLGYSLKSHRIAVHGAGPCPVHVKEAMIEWWGPILHEYYAGTEGIGACAISSDEWLLHKGSVGRPTDGLIHVLDEHEQEVPAGTTGTIFFETQAQFSYWKDSDKTDASRSHQGYWTYGDVGHVDDEGYLYLTDRRDFTIISGGVNIYPVEIEEALLRHPEVLDSAVFGVPDDEFGDAVHAVVQVSGTTDIDGLDGELRTLCRTLLGPVRVPRTFAFVLDFPRLPTGKLRKKELRDAHLKSLRSP